jgi:hypothetical protein
MAKYTYQSPDRKHVSVIAYQTRVVVTGESKEIFNESILLPPLIPLQPEVFEHNKTPFLKFEKPSARTKNEKPVPKVSQMHKPPRQPTLSRYFTMVKGKCFICNNLFEQGMLNHIHSAVHTQAKITVSNTL